MLKYDISTSRLTIDYLDKNGSTAFFHRPIGSFLIVNSHDSQLKRKKVKEYLKEFRKKIPELSIKTEHINDSLQQPVLLIDGSTIQHNEAGIALANLKAKNIFNMAFSSRAPMELYGQDAKNGLIQIWLKEKK